MLLQIYLSALLSIQRGKGLTDRAFEVLRESVRLGMTEAEKEVLLPVVRVREELSRNDDEFEVEDFGAGSRHHKGARTISAIYRTSAIPHWWGVFLFRLVRGLRPQRVLELGTNMGVSAAYIQTALDLNGSGGKLVTIEGDTGLAELAGRNLAKVSSSAVDIVAGRFQDVLVPTLQRFQPVDMIFIDGHHAYDAVLNYYKTISEYTAPENCIIFDDVYPWTLPVRRAWDKIVRSNTTGSVFDTAKFGILIQ